MSSFSYVTTLHVLHVLHTRYSVDIAVHTLPYILYSLIAIGALHCITHYLSALHCIVFINHHLIWFTERLCHCAENCIGETGF